MGSNHSIIPAQAEHSIDGCRKDKRIVMPDDVENMLGVVLVGWILAGVTLLYLGRFDLVRFFASGGVVTCVVMLSSGLSVLIAATLQRFRARS